MKYSDRFRALPVVGLLALAGCGSDVAGSYNGTLNEQYAYSDGTTDDTGDFDMTATATTGANNAITVALTGVNFSCMLTGTMNGTGITFTDGQTCTEAVAGDAGTSNYTYTFTGATGQVASTTTFVSHPATTSTRSSTGRRTSTRTTTTTSTTTTYLNLTLRGAFVNMSMDGNTYMGTFTTEFSGSK